MSIIRNGTTFDEIIFINTNMVKVIRNQEIVFEKISNKYILKDGILIDGVTVTNANTSYGVIYKKVDDDGEDDSATTAVVTLSGIDLTGYDHIYFHSAAKRNGSGVGSSNHYGTVYLQARVDTTDAYTKVYSLDSGTAYSTNREYEFTLDISAYEGVHDINIRLYAKNNSTYTGYSSMLSLNLDEIYLYNGISIDSDVNV